MQTFMLPIKFCSFNHLLQFPFQHCCHPFVVISASRFFSPHLFHPDFFLFMFSITYFLFSRFSFFHVHIFFPFFPSSPIFYLCIFLPVFFLSKVSIFSFSLFSPSQSCIFPFPACFSFPFHLHLFLVIFFPSSLHPSFSQTLLPTAPVFPIFSPHIKTKNDFSFRIWILSI